MKNNNYTFQIYYSKKYKLFDLVINKNNNFYKHFHLETIKEINKIINNLLKKLILWINTTNIEKTYIMM